MTGSTRLSPRASQPALAEPPSRRELLLAVLVASLLGLAFLAEPLLGGGCTLSFALDDPRLDVRPWAVPVGPDAELLPINPITPDIDLFVLPGAIRMRQMLAQGQPPWWDEGQLLGYPLLGNVPYPYTSPLTWPSLLLDPITGFDVMLFVHTVLAAVLAWRAARLWGAGAAAAAVAGVGFALSTWMITRWHLPQIVYTSTWWPGMVGAVGWFRLGRRRRGVLEATVCGAFALVSGFPQVAIILLGGLVLLVAFERWRTRPGDLACAIAAALLAGLIAAPVFVLSSGVYAGSLRADAATRAATSTQGLPPGALLGAILPEAFGRPSDFSMPDAPAPTMKAWLPQRWLWSDDLQDNVVENSLYPGALVLLLLGAALRRRESFSLLAVGTLPLLACLAWPWLSRLGLPLDALGAGNIKRVLVLWAGVLPFVAALTVQAVVSGRARVPTISTVVLVLAVIAAPVAATWLDDPDAVAWATRLESQGIVQLVFLVAGLVALMLASGGRRLAVWAPSVVLLVDLVLRAWVFNPFPPQSEAFPVRPVIETLAARSGRFAVLGDHRLLPPSTATLFGLRAVHGVAPMVGTRAAELIECVQPARVDRRDPRIVEPFDDPAVVDHAVLDLLGVDVLLHADPERLANGMGQSLYASEAEGLALELRPGVGPRAFLCEGARLMPDRAERLAWLADLGAPVHATVLIEIPTARTLPASGRMVPASVEASANAFELLVDAPFAGLLVLTEAADPGWTVRVDGEPASVLIADHALMAVELGPGPHTVRFRYRPPGLLPALGIGALGLAILLALALWRRQPSGASQRGSPAHATDPA